MSFPLFFFFFLSRATHIAYGGSQARVELELQLPTYATATAMPDPSRVCDLHHCSQQCWILNPLSEARDQICILMDTGWVLNQLSHSRNAQLSVLERFLRRRCQGDGRKARLETGRLSNPGEMGEAGVMCSQGRENCRGPWAVCWGSWKHCARVSLAPPGEIQGLPHSL